MPSTVEMDLGKDYSNGDHIVVRIGGIPKSSEAVLICKEDFQKALYPIMIAFRDESYLVVRSGLDRKRAVDYIGQSYPAEKYSMHALHERELLWNRSEPL